MQQFNSIILSYMFIILPSQYRLPLTAAIQTLTLTSNSVAVVDIIGGQTGNAE
jgi:hypothetical protein